MFRGCGAARSEARRCTADPESLRTLSLRRSRVWRTSLRATRYVLHCARETCSVLRRVGSPQRLGFRRAVGFLILRRRRVEIELDHAAADGAALGEDVV